MQMHFYKSYRKLKFIFFIAFFLVAALIALVIIFNVKIKNQNNDIDEATYGYSMSDSLSSSLQDVRDGESGYLLTKGEAAYITFYHAIDEVKNWETTIDNSNVPYLKSLVADQQLTRELNKRLDVFRANVESYHDSTAGFPENPVKFEANNLDKRLQANMVEIKAVSREKLKRAVILKSDYYTDMLVCIISIVFVLIFLLFASYKVINAYFRNVKRAESVLQYNASLIKNINDPIVTTDGDYLITNWNLYAEELFGYTEAEVLGKHMGKLLKIQYLHTVMPEMMAIFVIEKDWRGEAVCFKRNGERLEVEISSSIIKTNTKENRGSISVFRDITQRNLLQQQTEKFSEKLQQDVEEKTKELKVVFERVADAFIALDNEWHYTYINEKAAELQGITAEGLLGKKIMEANPEMVNTPLFKSLQKAKLTQKQQRLEIFARESQLWYEASIYPSPEGLSVYFRNITDRIVSQQNLQRIHGRLQYYIHSTPLAVIETDSEQKIILWNKSAAEIFGWTAEEVIGKSLADLNIINDSAEGQNETTTTQKGNVVIKNHNLHKRGNSISCQWYNSVFVDENGKTLGKMSLVEDITDREKMESELFETEFKFRSLVEQSMVGVYIIQAEKLVYINPTFAKIFGYPLSELLNMDPAMIIKAPDREKVLENVRSRITKEVTSINYQFQGVTKQGDPVTLEVYGTFTTFNGKPAIIGTLLDITQRVQFIEQLERNRFAEKLLNERFILAAKATNDAIWDWDITNNKIWGNQVFCDFMGISNMTDFSTEKFQQNVHPEDQFHLLKNLTFALKNQVTLVEEEFRFRHHDEPYSIIHDKAYIIYDESGRGIRMVGAFHDITAKRQAEQKLIIEKELSDSIINSLPGIFYLINKKGKLRRWNKNFEEVTKFSKAELENFNMMVLLEDSKLNKAKPFVRNVFDGGEGNIVTQLKNKDGETFDYQLNGRFINYEGEDCLLGVGINISERIKMQNQIIQSEEKYRTLIEQASDGIIITDTNGDFINVNTSITLLTGYKKEELLQLNVKELLIKSQMNDAFRIENLRSGESVISERLLRKKNGQTCPVEVSFKLLESGYLQGIVRDITSRKASEEALRVSEIKYRILFDKNPLPMFILSTTTHKFLDVNAAAVNFYGFNKEEFLQKNLFDLMSDDENPIVLKNFGSLIRNIQKGGVYNHYTKAGARVSMNTIIHDIMYEGAIAKLIVAADETEKIAAAENLKASHESLRHLATHLENVREAERTHMAREIHDELGQQLTGLKMDISWLTRKLKIEDENIQLKVTDILKLIDKTVVTVRRLATELRPSILDDLGLVSAMEWQSEEFEKRSEIKSEFTTNDSSVVVKSETATNIFRIFQESLTNVLRHAKATEVRSKLTANENSLELEIIDNGQGFNISGIEAKKTLGLLGMKERVHIMGGTCNIFSKPGQGTIVKILVPLNEEEL